MSERPRARSGAIAKVMLSAGLLLAGGLAVSPAVASIHRHHWQPVAINWTAPEKDAALVLDGETGKVLYSRNADAIRHPASLTKMMTLYLLFDQLKSGQMTLATPISVSEHAAIQAPTKLHVRPGTSVPADTAIKALVVLSANDMAVAIAETIGGTESRFAEMMTAKARELGMTHTFYHNASGLPDEQQITTANDLGILARHLAYDFPQYFHYFSTPSFTYGGVTHFTHDNLIGRYDGADGIKTGYTNASGFNLVSSVVRNGAHVIGVVMGGVTARRRDAEMMRLLDSTFASINQNPQLVARASVPWQTVASNTPPAPVIAGFQIAGGLSTPAAQPGQTVSDLPVRTASPSNADDEEAAESRPDPALDAPAQQPPAASIKSPPVITVAPASPPQPPPANTRVAMVSLPPPAMRPTEAVASTRPTFTPRIVPLPRPHLTLASYEAPRLVALPVTPKPRLQLLPKKPMETTGFAAQSPAGAGHDWSIQIGAFADATMAKSQLASYAERSMDVLGQADRQVIAFQSAEGHTLYRARFGPFPEREAREVCQRLTERGQTCFAALAQR
ncbi:MAG: serine hydrolase [Rhizomicrobium sp.]|jgi:D-alanyl-D-alanine carboxypeptidase